jgi:predicted MFS family arabinose efflux permease
VMGFGIAGYHALVPSVVRDHLHGNELDFGLMLGVFGIGSIIAAFFISPARRKWGNETVVSTGAMAFVVTLVVTAQVHSVAAALPVSFLAGMAWVAVLTSINVAMQMRSPDRILGRCLSTYQAVTFGAMSIGSWAWGVVADWRGLPFALHMAAGFLVAATVATRLFAPMPGPDEGEIDD